MSIEAIEKTVKVLQIHDPDATPDYLFQDLDYVTEDQKRLDAWKNDEWYFLGIRVEVKIHNWKTGNSKIYTSAGLWGIESDSDEGYTRQVAEEQLEELISEFEELSGTSLESSKWEYQ